MKYFRLLICLLAFLPLQACKNGAATVPELASVLFESLKTENRKDFFKTVPTMQAYEDAYANFFINKYPEKSELRKEAKDKAASMQFVPKRNCN